ncbi:hypothetical protein DID78_00550 [Candidatus Marinamargulisbacteria bacterium SCGC AG-343-D04]|nr:hypothetical protein DID78_00550 [Candidatus Marinamargulisbacteria bacterium SCGC AG-343-D04]
MTLSFTTVTTTITSGRQSLTTIVNQGKTVTVPTGTAVVVETVSGPNPKQTVSFRSRSSQLTELRPEIEVLASKPKDLLKKVFNSVHYIWFGKPITGYSSHLANIRRVCALKDKESVTLWTDNITPEVTRFCKENSINLCSVNQSLDTLFSGPFDSRFLRKAFELESKRINPNYARMSDILRVLCVWHFGGCYLDTDVSIFNPVEDRKEPEPNLTPGKFNKLFSDPSQFYMTNNNNDILATGKINHPAILTSIKNMIKQMSSTSYPHFKLTYFNVRNPEEKPGMNFVIKTTGPDIFFDQDGAPLSPDSTTLIQRSNEDTDISWLSPKNKFSFRVQTSEVVEDIKGFPKKWLGIIKGDIEAQLVKKSSVWMLPQINLAKYQLILRHLSEDFQRSFSEEIMDFSRCLLKESGVPEKYLNFSIIDYDCSMSRITKDDPKFKFQQLVSIGTCLKYRLMCERDIDSFSDRTNELFSLFSSAFGAKIFEDDELFQDGFTKLHEGWSRFHEKLSFKVIKSLLKCTSSRNTKGKQIKDLLSSFLEKSSKPFFGLSGLLCSCIHSEEYDLAICIAKKFPDLLEDQFMTRHDDIPQCFKDRLDDNTLQDWSCAAVSLKIQIISQLTLSERPSKEISELLKSFGFELRDLKNPFCIYRNFPKWTLFDKKFKDMIVSFEK